MKHKKTYWQKTIGKKEFISSLLLKTNKKTHWFIGVNSLKEKKEESEIWLVTLSKKA